MEEVDGIGDLKGFGIPNRFVRGGEILKLGIGGLGLKFGRLKAGETFKIFSEHLENVGETFEQVGETLEKFGDMLFVGFTGVLNSYPLFSVGKSSYILLLGSLGIQALFGGVC